MRNAITLFVLFLLLPITSQARTSDTLRVATYNILWMNSETLAVGDRTEKLRKVTSNLDADIIALQEVDDRAAAETVFNPNEWNVVLDDDSPDKQDIAFAVRKHIPLSNVAVDLDADDENFLAPEPHYEPYFPNRRDALTVTVVNPATSKSIHLVNLHAKSRVGGREETDYRRVGASRVLVKKLKERWPGESVIVLGDFNDNPDDQALNILETGDPETTAGISAALGPFLYNITEPLAAQDFVSHGASEFRLDPANPNLLNHRYSGSRDRNNRGRNRLANSGPILFDQILLTPDLHPAVTSGTAYVFNEKIALEGPGYTRPSDHLPVYVDIDWSALPR